MDSPQLIGDINMPVQIIEIEEVQIVETSDEALEAVVGGGRGYCTFTPTVSCGGPDCGA